MALHAVKTTKGTVVTNPPLATFLFEDTRLAIVWLILRVWLGYQWIEAGWGKLNNPAWVQTGEALKGFWASAILNPTTGKSAIAVDWYRSFLQFMLDSGSYVWFAKLVAAGEFLIGAGLILGAFVGIAAFFGGFMNFNFIMAGSASVNGLYFIAAVLLILAWKTAGYYGVDRFLLPRLGTPWSRKAAAVPPTPEKVPSAA